MATESSVKESGHDQAATASAEVAAVLPEGPWVAVPPYGRSRRWRARRRPAR